MSPFSDQKLYHISEEAGIEHFAPRPGRDGNLRVWAISAQRIQNYFFPRDCPRICIWADKNTSAADLERLANHNSIIAIERKWFERARDAKLFAYAFAPSAFSLEDLNAGYYTAATSQTPIEKLTIDDPLRQLNFLSTRLEVLEELHSFRQTVSGSSFAYSMIRMRNAAPIPPTQI